MQREIKFRVWNKDKAQWERHGLGMNSSDGALMTNHNEDVELGQFTGLKDTNGKEIYEGDVVRVSYEGALDWLENGDDEVRVVDWGDAGSGRVLSRVRPERSRHGSKRPLDCQKQR